MIIGDYDMLVVRYWTLLEWFESRKTALLSLR